MRSSINKHTVALELEAAVKKLKKKYPRATYVGGHMSVAFADWHITNTGNTRLQMSVHHDCLEGACVVTQADTLPECLADIHNQLKEFAHLLQ